MMKYDIEYIKWVDSFGCSSGWSKVENLKAGVVMYCYSAGYVVDENDLYVMVVPHMHPENELTEDCHAVESGCGDMSIPKVAIVERKILKKGKG